MIVETKFNVGDILAPIIDDTGFVKLHVCEVSTQECAAKIKQVFYHCRVYTQRFKGGDYTLTSNLFRFNEMEVKKWEPPKV